MSTQEKILAARERLEQLELMIEFLEMELDAVDLEDSEEVDLITGDIKDAHEKLKDLTGYEPVYFGEE